jgi:hypothetical protein
MFLFFLNGRKHATSTHSRTERSSLHLLCILTCIPYRHLESSHYHHEQSEGGPTLWTTDWPEAGEHPVVWLGWQDYRTKRADNVPCSIREQSRHSVKHYIQPSSGDIL